MAMSEATTKGDPVFYVERVTAGKPCTQQQRDHPAGWHFWNESWSEAFGPYSTEQACREALERYCVQLDLEAYRFATMAFSTSRSRHRALRTLAGAARGSKLLALEAHAKEHEQYWVRMAAYQRASGGTLPNPREWLESAVAASKILLTLRNLGSKSAVESFSTLQDSFSSVKDQATKAREERAKQKLSDWLRIRASS